MRTTTGATSNILIVDDDRDLANALVYALQHRGFLASAAHSTTECLARIEHERFDIVVTDVHMPGQSGIELCEVLRDRASDLLTIVLSGHGNFDVVVDAIRAGAFDYLAKPVAIDALSLAVSRALEHLHLRRDVARLRAAVGDPGEDEGIVGNSAAVREIVALVGRIADGDATVLVTGESGTGKELVARALHDKSTRRHEPFVAINCAAMPASLLESELFGHVRGAFTDAKTARDGLFVHAGRGTILLDEIGEMPIEMQVKILRVLQERTVRQVGGDVEQPYHARVVCATNHDLQIAVDERRFRKDLYYRINVVEIFVRPLRDRIDDVLPLAQHFLRRFAARSAKPVCGITPGAARRLTDYSWPGNVRQLENCIERALALCRLDQITIDDLPAAIRDPAPSCAAEVSFTHELITLHEVRQRYVRRVLDMMHGNKAAAARVLGIDRRSLYRRLDASSKAGPHTDSNVAADARVESSPTVPRA